MWSNDSREFDRTWEVQDVCPPPPPHPEGAVAGAVGGGRDPLPLQLGYRGAVAPCRWRGRRRDDTRGRSSGCLGRQDGSAVTLARVGCRYADAVA